MCPVDGQGGLECCNSWGRKESDMTERLNWTELDRSGEQAAHPYLRFLPNPSPPYPIWSCRNSQLSSLNPQHFIFPLVLLYQSTFKSSIWITEDSHKTDFLQAIASCSFSLINLSESGKASLPSVWGRSSCLLNDLVLSAMILSSRPAWQTSVLHPLIRLPLNTKTFWLNTAVLDIYWHRFQVPLARGFCLAIQMILLNCLYWVILI